MKIKLLKYIDRLLGRFLIFCLPAPVKGSVDSLQSILLIRPGGIGDAVLLLPAINYLKKTIPQIKIDILAEKRNSQIFSLCPVINHVFDYDRPVEFYQVFKKKYDVVIDTEQWHRLSAIVTRMIRSQVKVGYGTNERRKLFTHLASYRHDNYEMNSFFDLLKPLDCELPASINLPFLMIPQSIQTSTDNLLGVFLDKPFVALFPGASIPERHWGVEKFHELANRLIDEGFSVVIIGGQEDVAVGSAIEVDTCALNLVGQTTLLETAGVLRRSELLVSCDSGVLHIGVGLEIPTVSLFGPGIIKKWAPRGKRHSVINHELPCSPCTKFGNTPPCPIGAKCIQEISVDEVFMAVKMQLSSKRGEEVLNAI